MHTLTVDSMMQGHWKRRGWICLIQQISEFLDFAATAQPAGNGPQLDLVRKMMHFHLLGCNIHARDVLPRFNSATMVPIGRPCKEAL